MGGGIGEAGREEGSSDIIYNSRRLQVLFTPNFSLLTQLLKILEFRLRFKFSTFFKNMISF